MKLQPHQQLGIVRFEFGPNLELQYIQDIRSPDVKKTQIVFLFHENCIQFIRGFFLRMGDK